MIYLSLFTVSFLAATILPASSELTLATLLSTKDYNSLALLSSASIGNILGAVVNWCLGFYLLRHIKKKCFPFNQSQIDKASSWFKKFGIWSLLFSWLPIVGGSLTFMTGIIKIRFLIFLILVSVGKLRKYIFLYYLLN